MEHSGNTRVCDTLGIHTYKQSHQCAVSLPSYSHWEQPDSLISRGVEEHSPKCPHVSPDVKYWGLHVMTGTRVGLLPEVIRLPYVWWVTVRTGRCVAAWGWISRAGGQPGGETWGKIKIPCLPSVKVGAAVKMMGKATGWLAYVVPLPPSLWQWFGAVRSRNHGFYSQNAPLGGFHGELLDTQILAQKLSLLANLLTAVSLLITGGFGRKISLACWPGREQLALSMCYIIIYG